MLTGLGRAARLHALPRRERGELRPLPVPPVGAAPRGGEYEELPGWDEDITECRSEEELPQNARDYLAYIADFVGVPIALIGVGPGREQIIWTDAGRQTAPAQRAALA